MTPEEVFEKSTPVNSSTHLVVGITPDHSGCGCLASAGDEFTAHRYAAVLKKNGYIKIRVLENNDRSLLECQRMVEFIMMQGR